MVGVTPANITRLRPPGEADPSRATTGTAGTGPTPGGPAQPTTGGADSLRLSEQARALSEGMMQGPPVDRALVARLGSAIAEGRYPLDPDRIAAAMCADCFDLPG